MRFQWFMVCFLVVIPGALAHGDETHLFIDLHDDGTVSINDVAGSPTLVLQPNADHEVQITNVGEADNQFVLRAFGVDTGIMAPGKAETVTITTGPSGSATYRLPVHDTWGDVRIGSQDAPLIPAAALLGALGLATAAHRRRRN